MKLFTLLKSIIDDPSLLPEVEISGLQNDSRRIVAGDLFIAYPGAITDGRQYIEQAISAGAVAILYDPQGFLHPESLSSIPTITLPKLSEKLAAIASQFYDNPSSKLSVIGVTGTNGKTTIAYQLAQAYGLLGHRATYVGTLGQGEVHALKPLANTTPDALCLQKLLHEYVGKGVQYVCMEVSSHALSLGRVDHIDFRQAIYTNLSLDHLDFHGSMAAYALAKALIFSKPTLQYGIINQDDAESELMQRQLPTTCRRLLYGLGEESDIRAVAWETGMSGSSMEVCSPWGRHRLHLQSLGRFNVYNSLAVFACLMASNVASIDKITRVMGELKPSPGRMEIVAQDPCVIVDFAHTPDALENVLLTLADLKPNKLWVVFGCGGDRDRTKRPIMGRIASQYADVVVLTHDNPRTESPEVILQDILQGIPDGHSIKTISERRGAIHYALSNAHKQDIVLIAGKGHENYQIIGHQRFAFSDQEVVRDFLKHGVKV